MPEIKSVPVSRLKPDPDQPRKIFDEAKLLALGENMKQHGQQVPLIVWDDWILDGGCRWRSAQLVGIPELFAIVLAERPTPKALRTLQMSLDVHHTNLSPIERSDFLARIQRENNLSVGELSQQLNMKQPLVTKYLSFQGGCEEVRAALHAGTLDQDKAYTICQERDPEKQRELLKLAPDVTREQLRQKAHSDGQAVELRTSVAKFALPSGLLVTVQGRNMTLAGAIDAIVATVKELKKGQSENWDITTAMRVMRDRSRAAQ